jgi:hypothetical protein
MPSGRLTRIHAHAHAQHCIADGQGSIRAVLTMAAEEGTDVRQMQYGQAEKQLRELEAEQVPRTTGTPRIAMHRTHDVCD